MSDFSQRQAQIRAGEAARAHPPQDATTDRGPAGLGSERDPAPREAGSYRSPVARSPFSGEGGVWPGAPSPRRDWGLPVGTALAIRRCREFFRRGSGSDPVGRDRHRRGEPAGLRASSRAALGAMIVPLVALASSPHPPEPHEDAERDAQPARGVCQCGHVMSMHCHADCSGPCAVQNCPCEGRAWWMADCDDRDRPDRDREDP